MGLDMNLYGCRWLMPDFNKNHTEISENIGLLLGIPSEFEVNEVLVSVGYWRKANQIHKWFVNNAQEGNDDCNLHYVGRDQLQELKDTCNKVLADRSLAEKLLPTQSGFFFGSTDYDDYYFTDLENTIKIIDKALKLPEDWDLKYRSSW